MVEEVKTSKARARKIPETGQQEKLTPPTKQPLKDTPQTGNPENIVLIGETLVEIKPTKLLYQRNRTAVFYKVIETYPMADILAMAEGSFGDERDGDKALMDWLIAVVDNEEQIVKNYDSLDTGTVEKMLAIFKRVNKIEEKEAKLKNMEQERKGAV